MNRLLAATLALALGSGLALAGRAAAEEQPPPPEPQTPSSRVERQPPKLARVQIVLARYQGEKKLSSLPYGILVSTDGKQSGLRMGVEVPVTRVAGPGDTGRSFQYKNVGTNIDCRTEEGESGRFQALLNVEHSSVYTGSEKSGDTSAQPEDAPMFRTFKVALSLVLRDGQTVQSVASTDPVTGEVVKIDVTLNLVK